MTMGFARAERSTDGGEEATDILFESSATVDAAVQSEVEAFLEQVSTLEAAKHCPIIVRRDGKSGGYYVKCDIPAETVCPLLDMDARLDPGSEDSFRANRDLLTDHNTYKVMAADAKQGREFSDIIVEYTKDYSPQKPLKIWGRQHRVKAIQEACEGGTAPRPRHHGFRVFFRLSKQQRTDIALISNTNIAVSNDLFDRLQEETFVGLELRRWCYKAGLLASGDDFPDQGSHSETITVKLARTFVTNFCKGKEKGGQVAGDKLDENVYEPYLCQSGAILDAEYFAIVEQAAGTVWKDEALLHAGKQFVQLHQTQREAVGDKKTRIENRKGFRNKAMTESVISAWAYVAGLLQLRAVRLENHYSLPKPSKAIPDPLNAREMSTYKHDSDDPTYRGLGTRSSTKDRQRMAQLFLARSLQKGARIDVTLMESAVSQVVGLQTLRKGYAP
jgi:hypothetical protein